MIYNAQIMLKSSNFSGLKDTKKCTSILRSHNDLLFKLIGRSVNNTNSGSKLISAPPVGNRFAF